MEDSSLKLVQTLEKSYPQFKDQLSAAEKITDDSKIYHASTILCPNQKLSKQQQNLRFRGRHDWAFKWLLNKLGASSDSGKAARSLFQSWKFLGDLMHCVHYNTVVSLLNNDRMTSIIGQALEENFPAVPTSDGFNKPTAQKATAIGIDHHPSKRRKIETLDCSYNGTRITEHSTYMQLKMVDAISYCLGSIYTRCENELKQADKFTAPFIAIAGKTLASKVLNGWLSALCHYFSTSASLEGTNKSISKNLYTGLQLVLDIWRNRSPDSKQNDTAEISVLPYCYLPQSLLLIRLLRESMNATEKHTESSKVLADCARLIEVFLAKDFILPTKAIFTKSNADDGLSVMSSFLTTLRRGSNLDSSESYPSDDKIPPVSLLFEIAIRAIPLTSPKKRLSERPWIETLFLVLCDCIDIDYRSQDVKVVGPSQIKELEKMFHVMAEYQVTVSRKAVEVIAWNCLEASNLDGDSSVWSLLDRILSVDPLVFCEKNIVSESGADVSSQYLLKKLLSAISRNPHSLKDPAAPPSASYALLVEMLCTLIKAFASDRKLDSFLNMWDEQARNHVVQRLQSSEGNSIYTVSIWEDSQLVSILSNLVEEHMSKISSKFLSPYIVRLGAISAPNFDPVESVQLFAVTSFMKVFIFAVNHEAILRALQDDLRKIITSCIHSLQNEKALPPGYKSYILQLLAISCHKWATVAQREQFLTISSETVNTLCSIIKEQIQIPGAKREGKELLTISDSIQCIGSIAEDLIRHSIFLPEILKPVSLLINDLSEVLLDTTQSIHDSGRNMLLTAIAARPSVLELVSHDVNYDTSIAKFLRVAFMRLPSAHSSTCNKTDALGIEWAFLIRAILNRQGHLQSVLIKVALEIVEQLIAEEVDNDINLAELRQVLYLHQLIPAGRIPRKQREKLLDLYVGRLIKQDLDLDGEELCLWISFLLNILQQPCGTSRIVTTASEFIQFVEFIDSVVTHEKFSELSWKVLMLGETMVNAVIEQNVSDLSAPRSKRFFSEFPQLANGWIQGTIITGKHPLQVKTICTAVNSLRFHSAATALTVSGMDDLLTAFKTQFHTDIICQADGRILLFSEGNQQREFLAYEIAEATTSIVNAKKEEEIEDAASLEKALYSWLQTNLTLNAPIRVRCQLTRIISMSPRATGEFLSLSTIDSLISADVDDLDAVVMVKHLASGLLRCPASEQARFVEQLSTVRSPGTSITPQMRLLQNLIEEYSAQELSQTPTNQLSKAVAYLLDCTQSSSDIRDFCFAADSLIMLLSSDIKVVDQSSIEMVLAAVTRCCSASGPSLDCQHARKVFTKLYQMIQIILIRHRRRIQGRFGVLVSTLQDLLRCFFSSTPSVASGTTSGTKNRLPSWLATSEHSLTLAEAKLFTRLITSICSPSVAAVTGSSRRNTGPLTDETARARTYAGQYMYLVLLEFVQCALSGRAVQVEVRRELKRAMFAILEITNKDVMGAVNARLSSTARAVLGGIIAERRRLGTG